LQANLNAFHHIFAFFISTWARIERRMITGAHFLDAILQLLALEEGNKDILVDFIALQMEMNGKVSLSTSALMS